MKYGKPYGWLVGILTVVLLSSPGTVLADDAPMGTVLEGTVEVGGHVSEVEDYLGRVREFDRGSKEFEPSIFFDLFGYTGDNRLDLMVDFYDRQTLGIEGDFEAGEYVDVDFDHRSFIHHTDHDYLENIAFREKLGVDSLGADIPGGKMITREDTDPNGNYGIRWGETKEMIEVHLPFAPGTKIAASYRDQTKTGSKQTLGVDHCSNCHIRSHRSIVNEQTRDLDVNLSTVLSMVNVSYQFSSREFENKAAATKNYFMQARHPGNGGSVEEFGSRLNYDDENLEVSKAPDVEKQGHALRATVDLNNRNSVRGAFSYVKTENENTELALTSNTQSLGWYGLLSPKMRATASFTRRDVENDAVDLDFANWREGRPGGGQDFDYTRLSAYDRQEYLGAATLTYAVKPGHTVRLGYRMQSTDRDNVQLDPDDPEATKTLKNRIRASWNGRLSAGMRSRVSVEYEMTDLPFVSVDGICEERIRESAEPLGDGQPNDWIYYFQREKYGTGASLPNKAIRLKANLSRQLGSKASATAYLNFADEKNDDLNLYDFERSVANFGFSGYVFPSEYVVLTGGASYGKVKSNAKFCDTVMDG